ncbi:hypothetical protein [Ensifer aridi]|nr:hypothetical protein [Ensifer aridi]
MAEVADFEEDVDVETLAWSRSFNPLTGCPINYAARGKGRG